MKFTVDELITYLRSCLLISYSLLLLIQLARKTISIDNLVEDVLRDIQSKFIKMDSRRSWSLSRVVNLVLLSSMMNSNDLTINDWNQLRQYMEGKKFDMLETNTDKFVTNMLCNNPHF